MTSSPPALAHSLGESILLTLFDLVNHLAKNGQEMAAEADLTVGQWLLLLQVAGDPNFPRLPGRNADEGLTASAVARERGVARASVSPLVSALVRKGMLAQDEAPHDRRRKELRITRRGLAAIEKIEPLRRRANAGLFGKYPRRELESLLRLLRGCLTEVARARAEETGPRELLEAAR